MVMPNGFGFPVLVWPALELASLGRNRRSPRRTPSFLLGFLDSIDCRQCAACPGKGDGAPPRGKTKAKEPKFNAVVLEIALPWQANT
jgi:hypothetical protein